MTWIKWLGENMNEPKRRKRNNEIVGHEHDDGQHDIGQVTEQRAWFGPLPPPSILASFDEIVENGAERIFSEWEAEGRHRREYERESLHEYVRLDRLGRITAFIFAMSALGVASWCAAIGQPWIAAILGGGTIATVATALIFKERSERHSR